VNVARQDARFKRFHYIVRSEVREDVRLPRVAFDRQRTSAVVELNFRSSGRTYLATSRDGEWTLKTISSWVE
jgi:hypothetical protein